MRKHEAAKTVKRERIFRCRREQDGTRHTV